MMTLRTATNNTTKRAIVELTSLATLVLGALLCGCHSDNPAQTQAKREKANNDAFSAIDDNRPYRRWADAQIAAGARADGTLYSHHFDGDNVNSLGQQKLVMMLKNNDHGWPLVVFFNARDDSRLTARQASVKAFLTDLGLQPSQIKFEVGPNPDCTSPAAPNIARNAKIEGDGGGGAAAPGAPGGGAAVGLPGGDSGAK